MLERLGATDSTGAQVTPLGAKLAKLQVQMKSTGFHKPSVIKLDRCEPFFMVADISFFEEQDIVACLRVWSSRRFH